MLRQFGRLLCWRMVNGIIGECRDYLTSVGGADLVNFLHVIVVYMIQEVFKGQAKRSCPWSRTTMVETWTDCDALLLLEVGCSRVAETVAIIIVLSAFIVISI